MSGHQNLVLYRLKGAIADRVEVKTGRVNMRSVEILSGLAEGDRVISVPTGCR